MPPGSADARDVIIRKYETFQAKQAVRHADMEADKQSILATGHTVAFNRAAEAKGMIDKSLQSHPSTDDTRGRDNAPELER